MNEVVVGSGMPALANLDMSALNTMRKADGITHHKRKVLTLPPKGKPMPGSLGDWHATVFMDWKRACAETVPVGYKGRAR